MIGEITPLVQVAGRRVWLTVAGAYTLGAVFSAAMLGLALGGVGLAVGLPGPRGTVSLIGGLAFLACALRDAGAVRWVLPAPGRQTPRWFRAQFAPPWYGLLWGVDLGQGWTTRILITGYYGLVLRALLDADPMTGAALLGGYGLGRALPVLVAGVLTTRKQLGEIYALAVFRQQLLQQVTAVALGLVGGYLLVAGWR